MRTIDSSLPLIIRDSKRRGNITSCRTGRKIQFSDNSPANWVFQLALRDEVPSLEGWPSDNLEQIVPLTFLSKGAAARRQLNRMGWKICHIDPVSDGTRYDIEMADEVVVRKRFLRLMSPQNMFLIPKSLSGAGEIPQVIKAIAAFDRADISSRLPDP